MTSDFPCVEIWKQFLSGRVLVCCAPLILHDQSLHSSSLFYDAGLSRVLVHGSVVQINTVCLKFFEGGIVVDMQESGFSASP